MKSLFLKGILVASLMSLSLIASAQFYIGGSIAGAFSTSPNASSKSWGFNIQPEVGYVLNDSWVIGARLSYGKSESTIDTQYLHQTETNYNAFTINPYAAYSPFRSGNFALWAEFGLQFVPRQNTVNYSTFGAYAVPVLTYNLGEHFVLKSNLGFAAITLSGTSDGDFSFAGSLGGESDLSVGFVYLF